MLIVLLLIEFRNCQNSNKRAAVHHAVMSPPVLFSCFLLCQTAGLSRNPEPLICFNNRLTLLMPWFRLTGYWPDKQGLYLMNPNVCGEQIQKQ